MTTISSQARKRRNRRLRHNIRRVALHLHAKWLPVAGKNAPARIGGDAVTLEWEDELRRHFAAERNAFGLERAADWLTSIIHSAAAIDAHFQADLMAAATTVGVYVRLVINSVHTLGPGRRSPVVPNSTRVAWSRASSSM